ncbi:hypothetical protein BDZ45DRAFT_804259 [Acephala macrosclerotiorum]|nr:hypothetical protein BDZ45DRAFT_804259 [Acephala macrosclerotiorum]
MKVSITLLTLLAAFAMASPAAVGDLEARIDCSTCGCSSTESCTFDVSLYYVLDSSDCWQCTDSGGGLSVVNKWTGDLDHRDGLNVRGSFSSLYGVLRWSLSSADEKRVPMVVS